MSFEKHDDCFEKLYVKIYLFFEISCGTVCCIYGIKVIMYLGRYIPWYIFRKE